jgi:hypothetical protein
LSRGVPGYVAEVAWIALIDPLVPKVKLARAVAPTPGVMFAPRKATARGNAFAPAELLALATLLAPLAPAVLLVPVVC